MTNQLEDLINSVDLADTLPSEWETSTIELLIGNDYYLDIVHQKPYWNTALLILIVIKIRMDSNRTR